MSDEGGAVLIAVLAEKVRALTSEVEDLRKEVDSLKAWRQWTIGGAFVVTLLGSIFAQDIKAAVTGR